MCNRSSCSRVGTEAAPLLACATAGCPARYCDSSCQKSDWDEAHKNDHKNRRSGDRIWSMRIATKCGVGDKFAFMYSSSLVGPFANTALLAFNVDLTDRPTGLDINNFSVPANADYIPQLNQIGGMFETLHTKANEGVPIAHANCCAWPLGSGMPTCFTVEPRADDLEAIYSRFVRQRPVLAPRVLVILPLQEAGAGALPALHRDLPKLIAYMQDVIHDLVSFSDPAERGLRGSSGFGASFRFVGQHD